MKIEQEFTVEAPAEKVWAFLTDPERVAAALPGAEITEKIDDTTYKGGMAVKVGPLAATYAGTVSFTLDEAARSATVHAKGQAKAGMGSAEMKMVSNLESLSDHQTKVTVDADLTVSGVLAQFGRGMIEQVSKKMFNEFATTVKQQLES